MQRSTDRRRQTAGDFPSVRSRIARTAAALAITASASVGLMVPSAARAGGDPVAAGEVLVQLRSSAALSAVLQRHGLSLAGRATARGRSCACARRKAWRSSRCSPDRRSTRTVTQPATTGRRWSTSASAASNARGCCAS